MSVYEQYLDQRKFWDNLFTRIARQDARDIYYQLDAWVNYDISARPEFKGDVARALRSIKAKTLIISATHDELIHESEFAMPDKYIPRSTRLNLNSPAGHLVCCGFDPAATNTMDAAIKKFLKGL